MAMSNQVEAGILRGPPFVGLMCMNKNDLRTLTQTIHSISFIVCHFGYWNVWNVCDSYIFLLVKLIKFFLHPNMSRWFGVPDFPVTSSQGRSKVGDKSVTSSKLPRELSDEEVTEKSL